MFPTGIFVRAEIDDLITSLPDRLVHSGPSRLTVEVEPCDPGSEEQPVLTLSQWPDSWCFIEATGPEELTTLVIESLVRKNPVSEVLSCHFNPEKGEYLYTIYREGILQETFESRGPSGETVNFVSEIRNVPLKNLLKPSDFMVESMSQFGVAPGTMPMTGSRDVVIHVNFPPKKTFWQALLGAVSSR